MCVALAAILALQFGASTASEAVTGARLPKCPKTAPDIRAARSGSTIAPTRPRLVILCHYAAMDEQQPAGSLVRAKRIDKPKALVRLLNQAQRPTSGSVTCQANPGGHDLLIVVGESTVARVSLDTGGCMRLISTVASGEWVASVKAQVALAKLDPYLRKHMYTPVA